MFLFLILVNNNSEIPISLSQTYFFNTSGSMANLLFHSKHLFNYYKQMLYILLLLFTLLKFNVIKDSERCCFSTKNLLRFLLIRSVNIV